MSTTVARILAELRDEFDRLGIKRLHFDLEESEALEIEFVGQGGTGASGVRRLPTVDPDAVTPVTTPPALDIDRTRRR